MPDTNTQSPPQGDSQKADKYLTWLIKFIGQDKLTVLHTNLSKFNPTDLQDHYRVELKDYYVEVSHSKQADSGADSFVVIFNNLKQVGEGCEKIILAYTYLTKDQYQRFKEAAEQQIERFRKMEEEKRFNEALTPIDELLEQAENGEQATSDSQADTASSQDQPKDQLIEEKPPEEKPADQLPT